MLYEIAKPFVMAVVRAVWRPTLSGHEHIPEQGPVILASNHLPTPYRLPAGGCVAASFLESPTSSQDGNRPASAR